MNVSRRRVLPWLGGLAAGAAFPALALTKEAPHVVIVGAGFAGTTAAKYLRRFDPAIQITVIEPNERFLCCPMSIRVICGNLGLRDIAMEYGPFFSKYGIRWMQASVDAIDTARQQVHVGRQAISYDALIVCTGVHFDYDAIPGMQSARAQSEVLHAWRAGPQTIALRDRLKALPAGATYGLHIPGGAIRAKTAAYERASMVAHYFKSHNEKAKVIVFDENTELPFGKDVLLTAWKERYGSMIEYVPGCRISQVDASRQAISFAAQGRHQVDLLNIIPPQRAGDLLAKTGLTNAEGRWCPVNFKTFASTTAKNVYVLGDVIAGVNGMAKSGQMANQEAKVCAAAIAAMTKREEANPVPVMISAGYTYVSPQEAFTSTTVYRYDQLKRQPVPVPGSGIASNEPSLNNGLFGMSWATNVINDMMG